MLIFSSSTVYVKETEEDESPSRPNNYSEERLTDDEVVPQQI